MNINGYDIKPGANLRDADLRDAILIGADLRGAKLRWADLTRANLTDAKLEGANFYIANLVDADLRGANLTDADLRRANLTDAKLEGAILIGADLRGANLTDAILTGANLTDANLRGAILTRADLEGANLKGANLTGANLTRANLGGANLTGADLTRATLPKPSSLKFCLALNSNIEGAITSVDQLLNLIKDSKSNKEESNIYKSHLKWIGDNVEQLIHNNYITDNDKAKIDDRRDSARLAQCSTGVNKITTYKGLSNGLTGVVEVLFARGVFNNDNSQVK